MFLKSTAFAALSLLLSAPLFAQKVADISPDEVVAINQAAQRGLDMYWFDQAAWQTTDTMRQDLTSLQLRRVRGWVVVRMDDSYEVTYFGESEDEFFAVYSANLHADGVIKRTVYTNDNNQLRDDQLALIADQQAINPSGLQLCSDAPFNMVTLPPSKAGDPAQVYLLTPQTRADAVPMGGHYRFTVLNGEVIAQRAFTNSCLETAITQTDDDGQPVQLEAIAVTHLFDPIPTEIHIFTMLAANTRVMVMTSQNEQVWGLMLKNGRPQIANISDLFGNDE